jgi:hypothetical protein
MPLPQRPCWRKSMKNSQLGVVISRWTSSTSGARSRSKNRKNRLTNDTHNPPIALFNLPDRKSALHKKVDLMTPGSRPEV